jgi:hypothetical protein
MCNCTSGNLEQDEPALNNLEIPDRRARAPSGMTAID